MCVHFCITTSYTAGGSSSTPLNTAEPVTPRQTDIYASYTAPSITTPTQTDHHTNTDTDESDRGVVVGGALAGTAILLLIISVIVAILGYVMVKNRHISKRYV